MDTIHRIQVGLAVMIAMTGIAMAQDTTGVGGVRGTVVKELGRIPLVGVSVCAQPTVPRCGVTDSQGRFQIEGLRPGSYKLEARFPGTSASLSANVELRAGVDAAIELTLPDSMVLPTVHQSIEVNSSDSLLPEQIAGGAHLISAREVQQDPSGMRDVMRYVQGLPGVVFGGDDFRNDIIVRGGSPLENLYVVDNVEIPNISQFGSIGSAGGTLSLINSDLLSDVTFMTGGYPAPYSNRLSSVMQITQREGQRDRVHLHATAGFAGVGGVAEGPFTHKGSWIGSMRRSLYDLFSFDNTTNIPIFTNYEGKVVYDVNASNRIWLLTIGGWDSIVEKPGTTKTKDQDKVTNADYRTYRDATGMNWQHLFGASGVGLLGTSFSRTHVWDVSRDRRLNNAEVEGATLTEDEYAIKYDLTFKVPVFQEVQAGAQGRWMRDNFIYSQPLGVESPFSPSPGRVDPFTLHDDRTVGQPAGYLQITRSLGRRVSLTAGGRIDHYGYVGITRFSPRASAVLPLSSRLSAHLSYGTYFQQPMMLYVRAAQVNANLVPMRADHYVAGLTYNASRKLLFSVEAYEKRYRDYPVSLEYPQVTLASAGDDYDPSLYMLSLTSAGRGRARGLEFYMHKKLSDRFYAQANFSIAQSTDSALDRVFRPSGFDSHYIFNVTSGYQFGRSWEVGARYVYYSGRPYTPFNLVLSTAQDRPVYDLTRVNGLRAPDYQRVDFRIDKTLHPWDGNLNIYAGLTNAFNRKNYFGYSWNYVLSQPMTKTQMGAFPLCGLEWRF
ncbi:MAG: TonB-dependent receptor [Terracidiphilus sp.]